MNPQQSAKVAESQKTALLGTLSAAPRSQALAKDPERDTGTARITPGMLPLVRLTQDEIDAVVSQVQGGMSNIQDIYPLAPLQEGILFHHRLQSEGDTYLLRSIIAFDTRGRLDAFLDALQTVVN